MKREGLRGMERTKVTGGEGMREPRWRGRRGGPGREEEEEEEEVLLYCRRGHYNTKLSSGGGVGVFTCSGSFATDLTAAAAQDASKSRSARVQLITIRPRTRLAPHHRRLARAYILKRDKLNAGFNPLPPVLCPPTPPSRVLSRQT